MKHFDDTTDYFWEGKQNWVDDNNVLLGYDYGSS